MCVCVCAFICSILSIYMGPPIYLGTLCKYLGFLVSTKILSTRNIIAMESESLIHHPRRRMVGDPATPTVFLCERLYACVSVFTYDCQDQGPSVIHHPHYFLTLNPLCC